jgi:hypothetical protein
MFRFLSWLAVGVAAALLVVASVAFSPGAITSLAFAISIGTLIVSAASRTPTAGMSRPSTRPYLSP